MALTIGQIAAVSYDAVVNDKRKPANQWAESAAMTEMERQGFIVRESLGATIQQTLDYRRNPGAEFLPTDVSPTSTAKTEVMTAASYGIAEISVPVVWSKKDEVQTPTTNAKVVFVKSLLENGLTSHDDIAEQAIFATSTNGFLGLLTLIPDSGQGSVGGIDAALETWWRNYSGTYVDDTDIENAMTVAWNTAAKGSGSSFVPSMLVSDAATQALFEGTQQGLQRYVNTDEVKAGFKILAFKTARYIFSQYAGTRVYFMSPKSLKIIVSKEYFRDKGETQEFPNANAFGFKIYSAMQMATNNKSRLALIHL